MIDTEPANIEVFFEKILQTTNENIEDVLLIEQIQKWAEKAQNFYSNITKCTLKYTCLDNISEERIEKCISLILKEEPEEGPCRVQVRESKFFETEIKVLGNIIPKIEKLIGIKIAPQFLYGSGEKSLIVMNNLAVEGFKNKDCKQGFSHSHMLMMIEVLAKFHAGSVALNEQQPGIFSDLNRYDLTENTPKNIFKNIEFCTRAVGKVVGELSDEKCSNAAPKFEKLAQKISHRLINFTKYSKDEFCVLNRGDCWINNIMFRENGNGEPIDVRLIDFQISVWSSPAIDLLFLLSVCPELNIKCEQDDFFIDRYLTILRETMQRLNCKKKSPTVDELKNSLYKRRSFAVKSGIIFYSKLVAGKDNVETIEDILEKGYSDMAIFRHQDSIKVLKKIVPLMNEKGYLD
ncbi:hypothetical protein PV327_007680 [Microctonus hyperodae]|uniref:CHK kinase-like domain-containing protein n=1 Tax=Microctonus hyperodae TaxID=165561 RepID=A0AA39FZP9_MICHY|nr:hypothetical protein PV327_007680 [Microctonus hyperodae]